MFGEGGSEGWGAADESGRMVWHKEEAERQRKVVRVQGIFFSPLSPFTPLAI